jgi:hypothetical protein
MAMLMVVDLFGAFRVAGRVFMSGECHSQVSFPGSNDTQKSAFLKSLSRFLKSLSRF